jgi:hypothetical protein
MGIISNIPIKEHKRAVFQSPSSLPRDSIFFFISVSMKLKVSPLPSSK